jgi:mono/diheme cytochrome c family protein
MNYPVWYLPDIGGSTLIALIAIVHVFVSHFAVGGGLYLVLAERKGVREQNSDILAFTRGHSKFFLLVTMVFGGLTGVGIWFIISLVQPAGTSLLIHNFVFGWATEWVFFLVEIVALFIYFYTFDRMERRTHLAIGWIYFVSAWCSLFFINGIIGFMLTPGQWLIDGDFWSGFFNPTFWPSLVFRTFVAVMMAGLYAYVTCAWQKNTDLKLTMTRYSGKWVLISLAGAVPSGFWYISCLPQSALGLVKGASPTIVRALDWGLYAVIAILLISLIFTVIMPVLHNRVIAFTVLACGLLFIGSFEWTREAARRPYVINEVMYSNGILKADVDDINRQGFLHSARWVRIREFHDESLLEIGQDLFKLQCHACHTVGGVNNDIIVRTATFTYPTLMTYLQTIHQRRYFMPPFVGTPDEMRALATWIVTGLHGKPAEAAVAPAAIGDGEGPGGALFQDNCIFCHGMGLVKTKTADWSPERIRNALDKLSALNPAMPDYAGSAAEKDLLAAFILSLNAAGSTVPAVEEDAGETVFESHCAMCHSLVEGYNPLLPKVSDWNRERIRSALDMLEKLKPAMPPMVAPAEDKDVLAAFLYQKSQGGQP